MYGKIKLQSAVTNHVSLGDSSTQNVRSDSRNNAQNEGLATSYETPLFSENKNKDKIIFSAPQKQMTSAFVHQKQVSQDYMQKC